MLRSFALRKVLQKDPRYTHLSAIQTNFGSSSRSYLHTQTAAARHASLYRNSTFLAAETYRRPSKYYGLGGKQSTAAFHASRPNQGLPAVAAVLAGALKASVSIEYARTLGRIALTFVPLIWVKNKFMRKWLKHIKDDPATAAKKIRLQEKIEKHRRLYRFLMLTPIFLFALTMVASMERTPLTGRWRVILLSPDEEHAIAKQLAGQGWYDAVGEILSQDGPVKFLPQSDWRYQWVQESLKHLESIIPYLAMERYTEKDWLYRDDSDPPMPPPVKYPLKPRPAAKELLRLFCEVAEQRHREVTVSPHTVPGPPYSLLIVDKPDCENAFSFGYGPDGGGGIVVYSGFLDRILSECPLEENCEKRHSQRGFFSSLFPSFTSSSNDIPPQPTAEANSRLAILLAHELSHLILCHHLESLSSGTIIIPGTLSIAADILRVLVFPITMLFGPFVNDAVASLGTVGLGEIGKLHEHCASIVQEFEADAVSARLLAHAGYDARDAVKFWEARHDLEMTECSTKKAEQMIAKRDTLVHKIMSSTHPMHEVRVKKLREELQRWEDKRLRVIKKLKHKKWAEHQAQH